MDEKIKPDHTKFAPRPPDFNVTRFGCDIEIWSVRLFLTS